jgi:general stress protein 26
MKPAEVKRRLLAILGSDGFVCVLSTVDAEGRPQSRYMGALTLEKGKVVYMSTYSEARKVGQIRANPNVQILGSTEHFAEIVSVNGKAAIEESLPKKKAFWKAHPICATYFPGPDAPEFTLIRIALESGEYTKAEESYAPVQVSF